jgi:hypothetical protein
VISSSSRVRFSLVGAVLQELVDQIAVGAVDFDAVEAGGLGANRALTELLDDLLDLVDLKRAGWRCLDPAIPGENEILDRNGRWRQWRNAAGHRGVTLPANVPELQKDHAAFGVHGVSHLAPAVDLRIGVDAGCTEIAASLDGDGCGFGNLKAAPGGTLAIIVDHHGARHIAGLVGTKPGQRRLDDTMAQTNCPDLDGIIKFGHGPLLLLEFC